MGEPSNGWIVRSRADFFDASLNPLSDQAKCLFLILEGHARHRTFCYPRNITLARLAGKSERAVRGVFSTLEEAGWILRVMVPGKKSDRQGIILLRRSDPSMPAASTPELIDKAKSELLKERGGPSPSRQKSSASAGNFLPHNKYEWNYTTEITGVEENDDAQPPADLFADMGPEELRDMMIGIESHPNDNPLVLTTSRTAVADPGVERSAAYQEAVGRIRARRIRLESDERIRAEIMENARLGCRINGLSEALAEAHMQGVREALDRELAHEDRHGPYLPTA